jgi:hypothetical protein
MMRLIDVRRLQAAVQSISTCTAPTVQVGNVRAVADRLNSPYISRHLVEYQVVGEEEATRGAALVAWSPRYFIQVGGEPPTPYPLQGYVSEVREVEVPTSFLDPLLELCWDLGLHPEVPQEEALVKVYFFTRALAGFHFGQPVYWLADGEKNSPLRLEGEPLLQQGSLALLEDIPVPYWCYWEPGGRFFNHILLVDQGSEDDELPAQPAAVVYRGQRAAVVRVYGPGKIISPDHEPVELPAGGLIALHPFPRREGMD